MQSDNRITVVTLAGLIALPAGMASVTRADSPTSESTIALGVAAEGYSSYIESFKYFRCRFTIADYEAESVDAAIRGNYRSRTGPVIYGEWSVRNKDQRYRLGCDPNELGASHQEQLAPPAIQNAGQNRKIGILQCLSANFVSDGEFDLSVGSVVQAASLSSALNQSNRAPSLGNPLFLSSLNPPSDPGTILRRCLEGSLYGRAEKPRQVLGRDTLVFSCGTDPQTILRRFYLDPRQGFFTIQIDHIDQQTGRLSRKELFTDFIECAGSRWFPKRAITIFFPAKPRVKPFQVREYKTTFLDVVNVPQDQDFATIIPKGYQINSPESNIKLITVREDEKIYPKDLKTIAARLDASEDYWKQIAAQREGLSGSGFWRGWVFISLGVLAVLLIGGVYFWRRHLHGTRSP